MTEKENNLLAVFEERVHDLVKLCDDRKRHIEELEASLKEKDEIIRQTKHRIELLYTKYTNLLTARRLAENEEEFRNARKQVNKLVREVDTCIALLNE
ncbi:MAG: hypothetical protein LBG96_09480 [Tannerella sp.]|jgi:peptidoglycan hydrolase CwlO-like protein|nr:hypothetical protein [Tannerella sp.]